MHGYCSSSIHYFNNFQFRSFFFSLFSIYKATPSLSASSSDTHTPTDKIKNQPQKVATKIKNQPQTPQNQTHPHTDTPTKTKRVDRCLDRQVDQREEQGIEEEEVAVATVNGEP